MNISQDCNYFVTGTDTNVGKTIISAWLCLHSKKQYWKPIQTGADNDDGCDKVFIDSIVGAHCTIDELYKLQAPLSPHLAAKAENVMIDVDMVIDKCNHMRGFIIEGAGGVMVPIIADTDYTFLDMLRRINMRVILVASTKLGTINHTLLTIRALDSFDIPIHCLILNGDCDYDLIGTISSFYPNLMIRTFPALDDISRASILSIDCDVFDGKQ